MGWIFPYLDSARLPPSEKFQAPRGTHDVLPADAPLWFGAVVRTMEEQARLYGYRRIQTPVFEDTGLFQRTSGEARTSCTRRCTRSPTAAIAR